MKVVPICGNLKFEGQLGFYRHIKRLSACKVKVYRVVERYLGLGREADVSRKEELDNNRGLR